MYLSEVDRALRVSEIEAAEFAVSFGRDLFGFDMEESERLSLIFCGAWFSRSVAVHFWACFDIRNNAVSYSG